MNSVGGRYLEDSKYLTEAEVRNLSLQELKYARNEIYARRGRKFDSSELQSYFNSKSWYYPSIEPEDFSENCFNDYEMKNLKLLVNLFARMERS